MTAPTYTATVYYGRVSLQESAGDLAERLEENGVRAYVLFDPDVGERVEFHGEGAPTPMGYDGAYLFLKGFEPVGPALDLVVLPHGEGLPLPTYETAGASAMDLRAAIEEPVYLLPGQRKLVPTGLSFAVPAGFEAQVRGRSGLAIKHGIGLVNGIGTIDSDFRGETCVILINHGQEMFTIQRGDRIAQLVIAPVRQVTWKPVAALDETARGAGAYGSTGRR